MRKTYNRFMLIPDRGGLTAGLFRWTFLSDLAERDALLNVSLAIRSMSDAGAGSDSDIRVLFIL